MLWKNCIGKPPPRLRTREKTKNRYETGGITTEKKVSKDKEVLWPIMPIKDRIQDILANSQKQTILLIKKLKNWEVLKVKVLAT